VLARRAVNRFDTHYSRKRFTLQQHVVLFCLELKKTTTYLDLFDELSFLLPREISNLNETED
jgi:hypothetical protein